MSKPLAISLAVLWHKRRMLPRYAVGFADLLAANIRERFGGPWTVRAKLNRTGRTASIKAA
jgi:hypothetical protein